jgi:two-component system, cell cycle sensor histidine kinase and response regulator CckA
MQSLWRRTGAPLAMPLSDSASLADPGNRFYRRVLLALTLLGLVVQILIFSFPRSLPYSSSLLSNMLQIGLGVLAVLATLEAAKHSSRFGRRTWLLAALALSIYTVGQVIFTYSLIVGQPHPRQFGAIFYDPLFFFWIVPLIAAAAADPAEGGLDWSSILDFSLLVLLALAIHFSVFSDCLRWQDRTGGMFLWIFKTRLLRDVIVLGCLWNRVFFSYSRQIRALFLRLGIFYFVYTLSNAGYLWFLEVTHGTAPDTWIDLIWSVPRVVIVLLALTWDWPREVPLRRPASVPWRRYLLDRAPAVVPLLVLAISAHMFSSSRWLWGSLIAVTLVIVGLRLRLADVRHKNALVAERASSNLLQSIIEGTSDAVYLKDSQGRYLLMNSAGARLLGYTTEEIVGKTDNEIFPAPEAEVIRGFDREVMESGQMLTTEDMLTSAGTARLYLTTKNPYRDPQGKIIGVLGISVDITERRRMEQHLQKSQRMESIGTFSGGIAHDFNNLLTVIKGYSYLAHADAESHPAVRDSVDQITKATARASSLVDQLLAFSRRQVLQPRVINLNDIVANLRKMLDRLIGEDVEIQTQLAADLGSVKADPGQVEQVLMNLAANSRDAMPAGGRLSVETGNVNLNRSSMGPDFNVPPGSYVRLIVTDTGVGMDAETQARIFEPFFTTKPPGKGTGLGLATVYGIVKQSGGHIGVDSRPGRGTTFRIYLPRIHWPVEEAAPVVSNGVCQRGHQTVLVVDDDLQLRQLTHRVLTSSGFTVLEASCGEQAEQLSRIHGGAIDLLLTDVVMPGGSGHEVASRICRERGETRVLYMSGYPDDTVAHHGVINAGISFLQKPFSPDRLVEKVKEVLHAPTSKISAQAG